MAYSNIKDPSEHFNTVLYTGDGSADQSMTGVGFKPDFLWIKRRNASERHVLTNVQMGVSSGAYKWLDSSDSEGAFSGGTGVESFDSDGFTIKTSDSTWNASGSTYVFWSWKANGGTTSSNSDGDITSTVQANTTSGISIMSYSGTTGDVHTIGHGLGVTPEVWIVKSRSDGGSFDDWFFWHHRMAASNIIDNRVMYLNSNDPLQTYTGINAVTSSTIRVKSSTTAQNGEDYIAYAFVGKKGYSKFGSYVGNGSGNGPFVPTGFKPALVIFKRVGDQSWDMHDNTRDPFNPMPKRLLPNLQAAEESRPTSGGSIDCMDFLSNGFKIRSIESILNTSGDTYVYMAWAENPFVTSTGIPTTAR